MSFFQGILFVRFYATKFQKIGNRMSSVKQYNPTADFIMCHMCVLQSQEGLSMYRQFRKMAGILEHG